ncbi:MAG: hypothetical protein L0191_05260 [Acidobacteria bacterium]|nr:hypothetical protein [Acidobacteriota bacterium]
MHSGGFANLFGLGTDSLHDGGVVLSLIVLLGGISMFLARILSAIKGRPPLDSLQICRMLAVLGALGGFVAYLREYSFSHGLQDLTLGGLAALSWMTVVLLESFRRMDSR